MPYFRSPCAGMDAGMQIPQVPYGGIPQGQMQPSAPGMIPMPTLPTGFPTGPAFAGTPLTAAAQAAGSSGHVPQTLGSPYFTAGYLRTLVGKNMTVRFAIGGNGVLIDKTGKLLEVGVSYIVLNPVDSDDIIMCDLYAIRFVDAYD